MNIKSIVVSPQPDKKGYNVLKCGHCEKYFLIKLYRLNVNRKFCCPYCSYIGDIITFTCTITNEYSETPLPINKEITTNDFVSPEWIHSQNEKMMELGEVQEPTKDVNIKAVLGQLAEEIGKMPEVEVIEYKVDDIIKDQELTEFEFICCENFVKVPTDYLDEVRRCPHCFGEIIK